MKLQQFIDILDKSDETAHTFFKKYGKSVFINNYVLLSLLKKKWSKKNFIKLFTLRGIIEMEIRREYSKEKTYFKNILPLYRYFEDYMSYGCVFFCNWRIPFEEWEDLAKEQTDILKILVEKNQLKSFKRTNLNKEFGKKYRKRLDYFLKKGYITDYDLGAPSGL